MLEMPGEGSDGIRLTKQKEAASSAMH